MPKKPPIKPHISFLLSAGAGFFLFLALLLLSDSYMHKEAAPEGAYRTSEEIRHPFVLQGFEEVTAWAHAATLTPALSSPSLVEMPYMRLFAIDVLTGETRMVAEKIFEEDGLTTLTPYEGGLYLRYPHWYTNDASIPFSPSTGYINQKMLTINLAPTPDRIAHWWTPRVLSWPGHIYIMEVRMRIQGNLMVQLGVDFWRKNKNFNEPQNATCSNSNNCESWVSDWFGDTQGEFITVLVPKAFLKK